MAYPEMLFAAAFKLLTIDSMRRYMVNTISTTLKLKSKKNALILAQSVFMGLFGMEASALVTDVTPSVNYTTLHHFDGQRTGSDPYGIGVTIGKNGTMYGTTLAGGTTANGQYGSGTVYKIDASGNTSVLHVFDGITGGSPTAALTVAADGSLYGTTYAGGKQRFDTGIVYKIDPAGRFSVIHNFDFNTEGKTSSEVVIGKDGNLYGTTFTYGTGVAADPSTIFKITPTGQYRVVHRFNLAATEIPVGGLVVGPDGSLYGATQQGVPAKRGTIYKLTPSGQYKLIYQFNSAYKGYPNTGVTLGQDGSLYGTTSSGGVFGLGTVFRIGADGSHTILHHFDGVNGIQPMGVSFGKDGKLYGTASSLVSNGRELVTGPAILYRTGVDRSYTMLYLFSTLDGQSRLTLSPNGSVFYGTERSGGQYDRGRVFRIGFPSPTSISFSTDKTTVKAGASITLIASVTPGSYAAPMALVEAKGGLTTLDFVSIINGKAVFSVNDLAPGTHTLFAQYKGDGYHAMNISNPIVITVTP